MWEARGGLERGTGTGCRGRCPFFRQNRAPRTCKPASVWHVVSPMRMPSRVWSFADFLLCPGGGMADATDLKSVEGIPRAGSSPAPGTIFRVVGSTRLAYPRETVEQCCVFSQNVSRTFMTCVAVIVCPEARAAGGISQPRAQARYRRAPKVFETPTGGDAIRQPPRQSPYPASSTIFSSRRRLTALLPPGPDATPPVIRAGLRGLPR